jgi:2-dehydropantoate 2-reductase
MKIAVMGTGGVGGYFGGLIARSSEDVTFIARGAHLDAIERNGLRVVSDLSGEFVLDAKAASDPVEVGPVDLVLYTVKMYHNDDAIPFIAPMVGPETVVMPLLNGIDNHTQLVSVFGKERVMIGVAFVQARIREPGVIEQLGKFGRIVFGEIDRCISKRAQKMLDVFKNAAWNVELTDNALGALWGKFIYLAASAGVNAVTQIPYGEMRTVPETRELIRAAYEEIAAVGRASGAPVADDIVDMCMAGLDSFPSDGMASLAKDFRDGAPVELEGITGAVVRLGREAGVPTPINSTIYALLKPAALRIEQANKSG